MENSCSCSNTTEKDELKDKIRQYTFSIIDLAQYLDTNPEDETALMLHNRYTNELHKLFEKYQSMFGPLSINCPCNKWRWLDEPWPWEEGGF